LAVNNPASFCLAASHRSGRSSAIHDPALRQRFGQAGREIVLREFDEKIVLEKTFAVFRELDLPT